MPTPRLAPMEAPYETSIAEAFARIMPPGRDPLRLFRTMAHNPRILQRMFAGSLLDKGSIALREREIVILRTCARCKSEYEWGVHVAFFAERAGLTKEDVAATLQHPPVERVLPAAEWLLLRMVDALHDTASIPDELWSDLAEHFTKEQLIELIALTGYYHTISFMTNALRIETEPDAMRFADYRPPVETAALDGA